MTAKNKRLYPWIARAVLLAVLALMCASLFHFRDFRAYGGVWYRKRVALYMLPTLFFCAMSLVYPRVLKWNRPGLFRTVLMIGGIVISTFMFQRMTWGITWGYPVKFDSTCRWWLFWPHSSGSFCGTCALSYPFCTGSCFSAHIFTIACICSAELRLSPWTC